MPLSIARFQCDATPPIGTALCHGGCPPASRIVDPLSARGVIILADGDPIVLCAVDWVCISNSSHDAWRMALAEAAQTDHTRVAVHTLHPHDAPGSDAAAHELLAERGLAGSMYDAAFEAEVIQRAAEAVRSSLEEVRGVTHLVTGKARVSDFASNRRLLGPDGRVQHVRYSSCRDEAVRRAPEGTIDPFVRMLCFWAGDEPIASLTYYATHPQSFYGRGAVSADTVGLARSLREATIPQAHHVHFNGAGGNVAAGKYNDGSPTNRLKLACRLVEGMESAWETGTRIPIDSSDIAWKVKPVALPLSSRLSDGEEHLLRTLDGPNAARDRVRAARELSFARRMKSGHKVELSCLRVGPASVLHMPGELFVEYQLAAQEMRPSDMVCMAAYGDCGMSYIGTDDSYSQGGYESSLDRARVAPHVEDVLMDAMSELLA